MGRPHRPNASASALLCVLGVLRGEKAVTTAARDESDRWAAR